MDAHFVFCQNHKAPAPFGNVLLREGRLNVAHKCTAPRLPEPHQEDAMVRPWSKTPHIREVEILRDEKSA